MVEIPKRREIEISKESKIFWDINFKASEFEWISSLSNRAHFFSPISQKQAWNRGWCRARVEQMSLNCMQVPVQPWEPEKALVSPSPFNKFNIVSNSFRILLMLRIWKTFSLNKCTCFEEWIGVASAFGKIYRQLSTACLRIKVSTMLDEAA